MQRGLCFRAEVKRWYCQVCHAQYAFPLDQIMSMKWKIYITVKEANENLQFLFNYE